MGPDLTDALLDRVPVVGGFLKSIHGYLSSHKAIEAGVIAAGLDKYEKAGLGAALIGGTEAAILEKEGLPVWMASIGGAGMGLLAKKHPIMAIMGSVVLDVGVGAYEMLFGSSNKPSPNLTPQPAY